MCQAEGETRGGEEDAAGYGGFGGLTHTARAQHSMRKHKRKTTVYGSWSKYLAKCSDVDESFGDCKCCASVEVDQIASKGASCPEAIVASSDSSHDTHIDEYFKSMIDDLRGTCSIGSVADQVV